MNSAEATIEPVRIEILHAVGPTATLAFADDVRVGLRSRPYSLPSKYFYDDFGSMLFEAITRLPVYYLTTVERELLRQHAKSIVAFVDAHLDLVELGSGSAGEDAADY
jgi:L-histidine Nalpha-methyltransferase